MYNGIYVLYNGEVLTGVSKLKSHNMLNSWSDASCHLENLIKLIPDHMAVDNDCE